jgi:hypothetical protein
MIDAIMPAGHMPQDQCTHPRADVIEVHDFGHVQEKHCPDCALTWREPAPDRMCRLNEQTRT